MYDYKDVGELLFYRYYFKYVLRLGKSCILFVIRFIISCDSFVFLSFFYVVILVLFLRESILFFLVVYYIVIVVLFFKREEDLLF